MTNKQAAERIIADGHCDNVQCKNCPLNQDAPTLEVKYDCSTGEGIVAKCRRYLKHLEHLKLYKEGGYKI